MSSVGGVQAPAANAKPTKSERPQANHFQTKSHHLPPFFACNTPSTLHHEFKVTLGAGNMRRYIVSCLVAVYNALDPSWTLRVLFQRRHIRGSDSIPPPRPAPPRNGQSIPRETYAGGGAGGGLYSGCGGAFTWGAGLVGSPSP